MVRLRLNVKVFPQESAAPASGSPSRTLSRDRADVRSFLEIVDDPANITIDELEAQIGQRYWRLYHDQLYTKYLRDGQDDTDLDPDMSVEDAFVDSGRAATDLSDQKAVIKIIQQSAVNACGRFKSVAPEYSRLQGRRFDHNRPVVAKRGRDESIDREDVRLGPSSGAAPHKRLRQNLPEDINTSTRLMSLIDRDKLPASHRRTEPSRGASPLLIQDSQPNGQVTGSTNSCLAMNGLDCVDEAKSESPDMPSNPHSFPPTGRTSREIPESQDVAVPESCQPSILTGLTEAAQRDPSEMPQQPLQSHSQPLATTQLTPKNLRHPKGITPITPPSDISKSAKKHLAFKRAKSRASGIRKTPARRSDEVMEPLSEIEISQEISDSRTAKRGLDTADSPEPSRATTSQAGQARKGIERDHSDIAGRQRHLASTLENEHVFEEGTKRFPKPPNYESNMIRDDESDLSTSEHGHGSEVATESDDSASEVEPKDADKENQFGKHVMLQGDEAGSDRTEHANAAGHIDTYQEPVEETVRGTTGALESRLKKSKTKEVNVRAEAKIDKITGVPNCSGEPVNGARSQSETVGDSTVHRAKKRKGHKLVNSIEQAELAEPSTDRASGSKQGCAIATKPKKPSKERKASEPAPTRALSSIEKSRTPDMTDISSHKPRSNSSTHAEKQRQIRVGVHAREEASGAASPGPTTPTAILPPGLGKIPLWFIEKEEQRSSVGKQRSKDVEKQLSKPAPMSKDIAKDQSNTPLSKPNRTPKPDDKGRTPSSNIQSTLKQRMDKGKQKVHDPLPPGPPAGEGQSVASADDESVHPFHGVEIEGAAGPSSMKLSFSRSASERDRRGQTTISSSKGGTKIALDETLRKSSDAGVEEVSTRQPKQPINRSTKSKSMSEAPSSEAESESGSESGNGSGSGSGSEEEAESDNPDTQVDDAAKQLKYDAGRQAPTVGGSAAEQSKNSEEEGEEEGEEEMEDDDEEGEEDDKGAAETNARKKLLSEKSIVRRPSKHGDEKKTSSAAEENSGSEDSDSSGGKDKLEQDLNAPRGNKKPSIRAQKTAQAIATMESSSKTVSGDRTRPSSTEAESGSESESSSDEVEPSQSPPAPQATVKPGPSPSTFTRQQPSKLSSSSQPRSTLSALKVQHGLARAGPGTFPAHKIPSLKSPIEKPSSGKPSPTTMNAQAKKDAQFTLGSDESESENSDDSEIVKHDETPPPTPAKQSHGTPSKGFLRNMWWITKGSQSQSQ